MFNEMNAATDNMTVAEYKEIYEAIRSPPERSSDYL